MPKVKLGLAGAGLIGRSHIRHIAPLDECELAAIADPQPQAKQIAEEAGARHFSALEDMLDAGGLGGVIVATPNIAHADNAVACIERGIPVLVEKPIADTVADAMRIAEASAKHNVPVLVGHHRRHNPVLKRARQMILGGALGRIASVTAFVTFLKPDPYFDVAWRREPGGGPVAINVIHAVDDLRYLCGEIAGMKAFVSNALRGFPVEDSAAVAMRFESGAMGTLTLSDKAAAPWSWELTSGENPAYPHSPEDCYFVAGTDGAIAVPSLRHWSYGKERGWNAPLSMTRVNVEHADPLTLQLRHFCAVIEGRERPIITAGDAIRTLAATLAIHEAAQLPAIALADLPRM